MESWDNLGMVLRDFPAFVFEVESLVGLELHLVR